MNGDAISPHDARVLIGMLAQLASYFETNDPSQLERLADRFAADVVVGAAHRHDFPRSAADNARLLREANAMNERLRIALGEYE